VGVSRDQDAGVIIALLTLGVEPDLTWLTLDRLLGLTGLLATILLGIAAIVIAVRSDHRASRASEQASGTLDKVNGVVLGLPASIGRLESAVTHVDDQVDSLRETILGFYRDIFGLVSASFESFVRASPAPLDDRAPVIIGVHDEEAAIVPSSSSGLDEEILRVLDAAENADLQLSAQELVDRLGAESKLYDLLTELYRLRIARQVGWTDAVLGPATLVRRDRR
jgi:hypothetical protein